MLRALGSECLLQFLDKRQKFAEKPFGFLALTVLTALTVLRKPNRRRAVRVRAMGGQNALFLCMRGDKTPKTSLKIRVLSPRMSEAGEKDGWGGRLRGRIPARPNVLSRPAQVRLGLAPRVCL